MSSNDRLPQGSGLSDVLDRNIATLLEKRTQERKRLGLQDRIALAVGQFAGSLHFIYIHAAIFLAWTAINIGLLPLVSPFDPSLTFLAVIATVESIFLAALVMINQNRMAIAEDKRAELSLQISLLAEHETTRLITLVDAIARHLNVTSELPERELDELKRQVPPERVLEEIERKGDAID